MFLNINNVLIILLFIILFTFYILHILNSKYYKNEKFKRYIEIIAAFGSIIIASGIIFQLFMYKIDQDRNDIQSFSSFSKDYINSIIESFIEHPEMNYFYEELFNHKINNDYKRNIILENQICMSIFAKTVEQIYIIKIYGSNPDIVSLKESLLKILGNFFKSPKFKYYYLHNYKPNLAGSITINFIQEHFGI